VPKLELWRLPADITSQVNPTVVKYAVVGAVMLVIGFVEMT
jgi:hypothetical protein